VTVATPAEEIKPIAVWDTRDADWPNDREVKSRWLRDRGLPVDEMYRAEFFGGDVPSARIFCYALDQDGRRYLNGHDPRRAHDHDKCAVATEPPRIVPLSGLPPRELLIRRG
jgi:hypothetical protein